MSRKAALLMLLPLAAAGCLVFVIQGGGNGAPDSGVQQVNLPDGGLGYRLPDGGITTTLVEAICGAQPQSGPAGTTVHFDGSQSLGSPGAEVQDWSWDFGDGTTGTGSTTSHTYADAGSYTATLTATDDSVPPASGSVACPTVTITP